MENLLKKMGISRWEPLNKGWSRDKKFVLTDRDGVKFLLRIFDGSLYDAKKKQFDLLKKVEEGDLPCSRAVELGKLEDDRGYMVLTWLKGESAEEAVPKMSREEAYRAGLEAGRVLQKLHSIPVAPAEHTWWEDYQRKIPWKIRALEECPLPAPFRETVVPYVLDHMALVKDREKKFSHADFHVGNMIVCNGEIGVIDFDKNTTADPYDEFKPFCWNVFASEYFETGLINGYFDNQIPEDFFPILALYAAESTISHLPWAMRFGEEEIRTAYRVADQIMEWYDGFQRVVPKWYMGTDVHF